MAKEFPDLTGDGKVTQADVLKGRGVFGEGGSIMVPPEREEFGKGGAILDFFEMFAKKSGVKKKKGMKDAEVAEEIIRVNEAKDPQFLDSLSDEEYEALVSKLSPKSRAAMGMGEEPMTDAVEMARSMAPADVAKNLEMFDSIDDIFDYADTLDAKDARMFMNNLSDEDLEIFGSDLPDVGASLGPREVKAEGSKVTYTDVLEGREAFAKGSLLSSLEMSLEEIDDESIVKLTGKNPSPESRKEASEILKFMSEAGKAILELDSSKKPTNRKGIAEYNKKQKELTKKVDKLKEDLGASQFNFFKYQVLRDAGRVEKNKGGSMMVPPEMEMIEDDIPEDTYDNISPEEKMQQAEDMLPDDEMEEEYLDFVTQEILEEDEQEYLFKALDDDPRLEEILDKVILSATEFAGSGEVEGPGTGISDSIPARLSDGEFVFTRKATDQIGADNLQMMMDDAERAYDGGLMAMAEGGMAEDPQGQIMDTTSPYAVQKETEDDVERQMLYSSRMPSLMNR